MDEKMELVERLRLIAAWHTPGGKTPDRRCPSKHKACAEAATLIEQQAAELGRLREACRALLVYDADDFTGTEFAHKYDEAVKLARTALGEKP